MVLEVRLDSTLILKTTFPICRSSRGGSHEQGQRSNIKFQLRPDRDMIWTGYQDTDDTTLVNESVFGSIWQAGADSGWLLLGVSFEAGDKIIMNTIHIAHPVAKDSSEIATGLEVITYISSEQE